MKNLISLIAMSVFGSSILFGCQRYSVSVNDQIVYTPPALFSDYRIADMALKQCVQTAIQELDVTSPDMLTKLLCPPGNIQSLEGLETFQKIDTLGLAGNQVQTIDVLANLKNMEQLNLKDNNITRFGALKALKNLHTLDARGNKNAECSSILSMETQLKHIESPAHCKSGSK